MVSFVGLTVTALPCFCNYSTILWPLCSTYPIPALATFTPHDLSPCVCTVVKVGWIVRFLALNRVQSPLFLFIVCTWRTKWQSYTYFCAQSMSLSCIELIYSKTIRSIMYLSTWAFFACQLHPIVAQLIHVCHRCFLKCLVVRLCIEHLFLFQIVIVLSFYSLILSFSKDHVHLHVFDSNQYDAQICVWFCLVMQFYPCVLVLSYKILIANNVPLAREILEPLARLNRGIQYATSWRKLCYVKSWVNSSNCSAAIRS